MRAHCRVGSTLVFFTLVSSGLMLAIALAWRATLLQHDALCSAQQMVQTQLATEALLAYGIAAVCEHGKQLRALCEHEDVTVRTYSCGPWPPNAAPSRTGQLRFVQQPDDAWQVQAQLFEDGCMRCAISCVVTMTHILDEQSNAHRACTIISAWCCEK